jgi:hypothetical protein
MDTFALMFAYKNRKDAWEAWRKLAAEVNAAGYEDLVKKYQPHNRAGHRQISKSIARLTEDYRRKLREGPEVETVCPQCGSTKIEQYMMPYGPMWCLDCGFSVEEKTDKGNPFRTRVVKTG